MLFLRAAQIDAWQLGNLTGLSVIHNAWMDLFTPKPIQALGLK